MQCGSESAFLGSHCYSKWPTWSLNQEIPQRYNLDMILKWRKCRHAQLRFAYLHRPQIVCVCVSTPKQPEPVQGIHRSAAGDTWLTGNYAYSLSPCWATSQYVKPGYGLYQSSEGRINFTVWQRTHPRDTVDKKKKHELHRRLQNCIHDIHAIDLDCFGRKGDNYSPLTDSNVLCPCACVLLYGPKTTSR